MIPSNWRGPRNWVTILIVVILGGWLLVLMPISYYHRSKLKGIAPADVVEIALESYAPVKGQAVEPGIVLTDAEVRDFLRLLAESRFSFPSHPKGGWTRFARIETRTKRYYLPIHASSNNGTLIWVFSGGTGGWNYGTLRNDALKDFVERVVARSP